MFHSTGGKIEVSEMLEKNAGLGKQNFTLLRSY